MNETSNYVYYMQQITFPITVVVQFAVGNATDTKALASVPCSAFFTLSDEHV